MELKNGCKNATAFCFSFSNKKKFSCKLCAVSVRTPVVTSRRLSRLENVSRVSRELQLRPTKCQQCNAADIQSLVQLSNGSTLYACRPCAQSKLVVGMCAWPALTDVGQRSLGRWRPTLAKRANRRVHRRPSRPPVHESTWRPLRARKRCVPDRGRAR